MNADTTNDSFTVTLSDSDNWPTHNVQITNPKECKNPFCPLRAAHGSDYCRKHTTDVTVPPIDTDNTTDLKPRESGPSRRDLQRQLDRLEGKLDALIAALQDGGSDDE